MGSVEVRCEFEMPLLHEFQIRALLSRCESALGHELVKLRGDLRRGPAADAATWELVVLDALLRVVPTQYEAPAETGAAPDFRVTLEGGSALWLDATFARHSPPIGLAIARQQKFVDRFHEEARRRGIPLGLVSYEIKGERTALGHEPRLPAEQDLAALFGSAMVRRFFDAAAALPKQTLECDLREHGIDVALRYVWLDPVPDVTHGHGGVLEDPRAVEDHVAYKKLRLKARQFSGVEDAPVVVVLGSTENRTLRHTHMTRDAASAAMRRWPRISAVLLVPVVEGPVTEPPRIPGMVVTAYLPGFERRRGARSLLLVNPDATIPLSPDRASFLQELNLNRWSFGKFDSADWSIAPPGARRRSRYAGGLKMKTESEDGVSIELPAMIVAQLLAGELSAERLGTLCDGEIVRQAARLVGQHREVVAIQFAPEDAEGRAAARVRITFGAPRVPLVNTRGLE